MVFSICEFLIDDMIFLNNFSKINDQNPLGSARYGSSIKIDRTYTTKKLGFEKTVYCICGSNGKSV